LETRSDDEFRNVAILLFYKDVENIYFKK